MKNKDRDNPYFEPDHIDKMLSQVEYNQLYQQQPANSPELMLAVAFWCQYYVTCERFDRTRCSIRKPDGTAIPASHYQSQAINAHAIKQRRMLMVEMERYHIDSDTVKEAKKIACRWSYKRQELEVKMIPDYIYGLTL